MKTENRSRYSFAHFEHTEAGIALAKWLEAASAGRGHLSILSTGNVPFPNMQVIQDEERFRPTLSCNPEGRVIEVLFWAINPSGQGPYRFKWRIGGRVVPSRESKVSHGLYDPKTEHENGVWTVTIATPIEKTETVPA